MNDDQVITKLRGAAATVRPATAATVTAVAEGGHRLRRRRRTMQLVGSGLGVAVVLAVGFTTVSALDRGDGRSTVTAASDPTAKPEPGSKGAPAALSSTEQQMANLQLLAAKLGPDFRVNPEGRDARDFTVGSKNPAFPVVEVVPGSPTAKRLPAGYKMTANGGVPLTATSAGTFVNDTDLGRMCQPLLEKGLQVSACAPVATSGGQQVQVQEHRTEFGKLRTSAGKLMDAAGIRAYFQRVDGSIVQARVNIVAQPDAIVTAATHDRAESLLPDLRDALVSFVADPKVGPAPGPAHGTPVENPGHPTIYERNQAFLQEALGSPTWSLYAGAVTLENNKGKYQDLPSPYFTGTASLESLTQAQFNAACGAKPGFAGCTSKTLPDGSKVYTNRWADRVAGTDVLRAESSAYYVRPDGTIAVATISLKESKVTAENRDDQVNGTLAWFDLFEDALVAAATDPRMKFDD